MSNEYSATFAVTGLTTLKLRRFKAGGTLTWNGATWVAPNAGGGFVFATSGVIAISEVSGLAGTYTNNGSLGSAVESDEFGYYYDTATNGVVPNGQIIQGGIVPTGAGGVTAEVDIPAIVAAIVAALATRQVTTHSALISYGEWELVRGRDYALEDATAVPLCTLADTDIADIVTVRFGLTLQENYRAGQDTADFEYEGDATQVGDDAVLTCDLTREETDLLAGASDEPIEAFAYVAEVTTVMANGLEHQRVLGSATVRQRVLAPA